MQVAFFFRLSIKSFVCIVKSLITVAESDDNIILLKHSRVAWYANCIALMCYIQQSSGRRRVDGGRGTQRRRQIIASASCLTMLTKLRFLRAFVLRPGIHPHAHQSCFSNGTLIRKSILNLNLLKNPFPRVSSKFVAIDGPRVERCTTAARCLLQPTDNVQGSDSGWSTPVTATV